MIELVVTPRRVLSWEQFVAVEPAFTIALDGAVSGPPRFDDRGPRLNLNHHEGVDRLSTRSTSGQVMICVKQGLFETFRDPAGPRARILVNDPDQDTSLAVWLLANHERISGTRSEPLLSRLCFAADVLDATAGAYPFEPESELMWQLAWIFQPYWEPRLSGELVTMSASDMEAVIKAVGERIEAYSSGKGGRLRPDTEYEVLHHGAGWVLVKELGAHARTRMFHDGIRAYVTVREGPAEHFTYSIGKMSHFVPFPLERLYDELNQAEGIPAEASDRWGGGNTIGGSPREQGSRIPPAKLARILDGLVA